MILYLGYTLRYLQVLVKIKKRAERFLMEKVFCELRSVHYTGTFLYPTFKALAVLSTEKRDETHKTIRDMCKDIDIIEQEDHTVPSPRKKFKEWLPTLQVDEIEQYINLHVLEINDILQWWRTHSDCFPKLATIAKRVFCIPVTSAASERNFSKAGLLITQRRSTIGPDHVNDILLIHNTN